jgi:hypothetical protein
MPGRDDKIYQEAAALWRQVYGESPPRGIDGGDMLERLMHKLPETRYARFQSRHLRASNITFPRRPD